MNAVQQGIVTLIRSSLTGEVLPLPEGFDLEEAYPEILRHGMIAMAYDGAVSCGVDKKLPVMQKLFQGYLKCVLHSEGQLKMLGRVCAALEEHGFDHLLLKGSILKHMYPKPELRQMGDADILIRKDQYADICPVMESLGFCNTSQGFYDYGWRSSDLYVELHHCLSNPYNEDFNAHLGNGWQRAVKSLQSNCRYEYSAEDHFVYLFVHLTKHYRDGGIGLKHVTDLWVYHKKNPVLDEKYVIAELEQMGIHKFYFNVMKLLSVWFEDAESDDVVEFIVQAVFRSGAFGTDEMIQKAASLRAANRAGTAKGAKVRRALNLLFHGWVAMMPRYPVLKSYPWLLPVFWPVRWGTALLFRRDNIQRQKELVRETSEESILNYWKALDYVGLDYTVKD